MNIERLDKIIESILLISGDGLKISDIASGLEAQKTEIDKAIKKLKEKYSGESGIHLIVYNGKIQLGSNPDYAETVENLLNPIREKALSNAVLETVAIIAYRQPITRLEVEQIRGVNCDYSITVLLKNNLIEPVGRKDAVGKPLLYGTTDNFLKRFRIESLDQLPDYEALLESIRVLRPETQESKSLYNEFEIPQNEDIPAFLQGEEVEKF